MECSRSGQVTLTVETHCTILRSSAFLTCSQTQPTQMWRYSRYVTLLYLQTFSLDSPVASAWPLLWTDYCTFYSPAVTICTAQRSLYVPPSGHYMYRTVVTICTASLTFSNSTFCPHSVFRCFVWVWKQTAIISLYSINWLVCITEMNFTARYGLNV